MGSLSPFVLNKILQKKCSFGEKLVIFVLSECSDIKKVGEKMHEIELNDSELLDVTSDSKPRYVLRSLRSFFAYCIEKDVQPLMCLDKDNGFLYVNGSSSRVRGPLLSKKLLDYAWNQIGVYRLRLRESFQLMQLDDPTFREV